MPLARTTTPAALSILSAPGSGSSYHKRCNPPHVPRFRLSHNRGTASHFKTILIILETCKGGVRHHRGRLGGPLAEHGTLCGSSTDTSSRVKKAAHATEQGRPDVLKRREEWFDGQLDLNPERLIFIDEAWASTNMARRHRHHGQSVAPQSTLLRETIEAAGAGLLFLPPHSPDVIPVEQAFSKPKAHQRKAAERTINGLCDAIGRIFDLFPPQECARYDAD